MPDTPPRVDPRFLQDSGTAIFTGNELLVKGALETEGGVHLMTGYPGSPIASFFDTLEALGPLLDSHGVCGKIASNEALSMAMVNGAQMAGCRAITAMKSVGVHVASDALALGVLAGTQSVGGSESGGLVILGDDPWSDSTQVPADSRFIAEHVRMPVLEPGPRRRSRTGSTSRSTRPRRADLHRLHDDRRPGRRRGLGRGQAQPVPQSQPQQRAALSTKGHQAQPRSVRLLPPRT